MRAVLEQSFVHLAQAIVALRDDVAGRTRDDDAGRVTSDKSLEVARVVGIELVIYDFSRLRHLCPLSRTDADNLHLFRKLIHQSEQPSTGKMAAAARHPHADCGIVLALADPKRENW
jgi:hypothetical protein